MKKFLFFIMLCTSIIASAESVNGSCLIGDSDYVEADFFYNLNQGNITNGIITISNGSQTPLVSLNIVITAVTRAGTEVVIYKSYAKFNPSIAAYSTHQIKDISYSSVYPLKDIQITIENPRCIVN